jgi:hypothetical protein
MNSTFFTDQSKNFLIKQKKSNIRDFIIFSDFPLFIKFQVVCSKKFIALKNKIRI